MREIPDYLQAKKRHFNREVNEGFRTHDAQRAMLAMEALKEIDEQILQFWDWEYGNEQEEEMNKS